MIEMTIRMFRDAGIKRFAALVFHNGKSTEERLGDGSSMDVEITYSYDPEMPVGRGGAIRHAIEVGAIPRGCNLIVANPSDIIADFPGSFPRFIVSGHLEGQRNGMITTAVLARGLAYSATGMMVKNNQVVDTDGFPFIPVPAHAGFTLFSPEAMHAIAGKPNYE
jgi:NDP-sugar pyrophosphorylase family protein